jgi:hypothetical protein
VISKLEKYINYEFFKFIKAVIIFDPVQLKLYSNQSALTSLQNMLFINTFDINLHRQFNIYYEIVKENEEVADISKFCKANKYSTPILITMALRFIFITTSNAPTERSLCIYKNILTDKRTQLSDDAIKKNYYYEL